MYEIDATDRISPFRRFAVRQRAGDLYGRHDLACAENRASEIALRPEHLGMWRTP